MARKIITQDAIKAFMAGEKFHRDNTSVDVGFHPDCGKVVTLKLHNNPIALFKEGDIQVTNAGWFSNTTKERLNGIPGVSVCQRKGIWYLNEKEWNGEWVAV